MPARTSQLTPADRSHLSSKMHSQDSLSLERSKITYNLQIVILT